MKVYAVMTDEKFYIVFGAMAGKIVHVDCGEQRKAVYCGIDVTSSDEFEEMDKGETQYNKNTGNLVSAVLFGSELTIPKIGV